MTSKAKSKAYSIKSIRSDGAFKFTVNALPSQNVFERYFPRSSPPRFLSPLDKLTAILRETNSAGDEKRFVGVGFELGKESG
jgi:hypothetical protein